MDNLQCDAVIFLDYVYRSEGASPLQPVMKQLPYDPTFIYAFDLIWAKGILTPQAPGLGWMCNDILESSLNEI